FAHRLSPHRIGMSGHSFGGQTTLRVALADSRVRAALAPPPALSDAIQPGQIHIPTMIQGGEKDGLAPFETDSKAAYARLDGPRFLLEISTTGTFAFSDVCAAALFPGVHDCDPGLLTQDEAHAFV